MKTILKILWTPVAWTGWIIALAVRMIAKILAPVAVPFVNDKVNHPVWGVRDTDDLSYWNLAVRNSAHNFLSRSQLPFETWAGSEDHTLEKEDGFQWRYRRSIRTGSFVSFRITWGRPRKSKGKREIYLGWTLNDQPFMRPVLQVRVF